MITSKVILPIEEEGAEVDGAKEVGGATICVWGPCGLSCALLHQTVSASMAPIMEK